MGRAKLISSSTVKMVSSILLHDQTLYIQSGTKRYGDTFNNFAGVFFIRAVDNEGGPSFRRSRKSCRKKHKDLFRRRILSPPLEFD